MTGNDTASDNSTHSHCSADMVKSMVKYVEERSPNEDDDTAIPTTSDNSSSGVSPLMSFVMANDTNYKQKFYKPLLKRPSAGMQYAKSWRANTVYITCNGDFQYVGCYADYN